MKTSKIRRGRRTESLAAEFVIGFHCSVPFDFQRLSIFPLLLVSSKVFHLGKVELFRKRKAFGNRRGVKRKKTQALFRSCPKRDGNSRSFNSSVPRSQESGPKCVDYFLSSKRYSPSWHTFPSVKRFAIFERSFTRLSIQPSDSGYQSVEIATGPEHCVVFPLF